MFGCRGAGPAWSTHGLRHGQIGLHRPVAGLSMTVAATGCGCRRGKERFDLVHDAISRTGKMRPIQGKDGPAAAWGEAQDRKLSHSCPLGSWTRFNARHGFAYLPLRTPPTTRFSRDRDAAATDSRRW